MIITVGIVDYGMGNHASVAHGLRELGFRVRISHDRDVLRSTNVRVLPGVGAFPAAMEGLESRGLVGFLREEHERGRPLIGICLGMQLLASRSLEVRPTEGLDIIPGDIVPLPEGEWHIGWNTLQCAKDEKLIADAADKEFYFNHSFYFNGGQEYVVASAKQPRSIPAIIRRHNTFGIQFHPEKSQHAGKSLLQDLIKGLAHV